MRSLAWLILSGAGVAFTALIVLDFVTISVPVHFGWLFIDYGDPNRRGHLKGVTVSSLDLATQVGEIACLTLLDLFLWRRFNKSMAASRPRSCVTD